MSILIRKKSHFYLHTDSDSGEYVHLIWNEHPFSDVNYKIYRKIKHDGVMGNEVFLTTFNHGTTNWTDDIQIAYVQAIDLAFYDVRAYYTPNGTYSDVNYDCIDYIYIEANIANADDNENSPLVAEESTVVEEKKLELL